MKINRYNDFLIKEAYDKNVKAKLIEMGVENPHELKRQVWLAKHGHIGNYLTKRGSKFTFGLLHAIFLDAINAKRVTKVKKAFLNILPSVLPLALVPFFPTIAIIGTIFGTSRIFHRVFNPLFEYLNPQSKYADFLKKMIDSYMKIPEVDIEFKDRFTRAFVVSDEFVHVVKPEILDEFSTFLCKKMERTNPDDEVPNYYIENELKKFINKKYKIDPPIPLKQDTIYPKNNDEIEYI